jgi:3-dehydroquinate synthetase
VNAIILSFEKKLIDEFQLHYMLQLPMKFQSPSNITKMNSNAIYNLMAHDKKSKNGKIKFVMIKNYGEILVDVSIDKKSVIRSVEKTEKIWFKRATAGL